MHCLTYTGFSLKYSDFIEGRFKNNFQISEHWLFSVLRKNFSPEFIHVLLTVNVHICVTANAVFK